jgi:Tfp pilus assembly protein PilW
MRPTSFRSPRTSAPERGEAGSTLVEVVFASALLLVVVGAFLAAFVSVQKSEAYVSGRSEALDDMRLTMARMTRDLRQGTVVAPTSTASHLVVTTYVRGMQQQVTYDANGSSLTRQVASAAAVEVQGGLGTTEIFAYAPSAEAAEVVTITLTVVPPSAPDTTVTIDSEVRLRNLEEA